MILVSRSSDRRLERRYHSAIPITVAGIALVLLGETNSQTLSIVLWSFVAMGIYSFFGPFFSIPSKFLAGFSAAAGIALINSVGNLGVLSVHQSSEPSLRGARESTEALLSPAWRLSCPP